MEINRCFDEDSELTNKNSLQYDAGIRVIVDFSH